jgi:branched-subunit amino acid ABC-type transport system permease component
MIANLVVGGLAAGCLYAMVGIAIVIVLNITDIANFARGEMAMLTTFFAYWLLDDLGLAWWQAVSIAAVFGLVQGIVVQQIVIRPLIGSPVLSAIIATLGLNVVLNSLAGLIWGHQTYTFPSPFTFLAPFQVAGVPVPVASVVNIAVSLAIIAGMTLFLRLTWTGLGMRAASQNQTVARLMGVSITKSSAIAWALGGMVGGIAGPGGALGLSRHQPHGRPAHQGLRGRRAGRAEQPGRRLPRLPCARRLREPSQRLSFAFLRRCDHLHRDHRRADRAPGRHFRPREGPQGVTGAADIAGLPAGLPKQPASRGLTSPLFVGLGLALACAAPLGLNGYALYLLTLAGVFALVALGLNLLTGYAGQISLCHAAFFGVGAYATALLTTKVGLPYLVSLPLGALLTTAIGAAAAVPALRLKNLYLAIATLGFGVVLQKIIFEWRDLTGGGGGLALPAPTIAGYELGATGLYYLTLAFVILGLWGAWNVSRGRTGRALRIIKESEIAAASRPITSPATRSPPSRSAPSMPPSPAGCCLSGALHQPELQCRAVDCLSEHGGDRQAGTIGGSIVSAAFATSFPSCCARKGRAGPHLQAAAGRGHGISCRRACIWGMVRRFVWKR